MCCVEPRTGYVVSVVGVTLCTVLCVVSVALPGWTMKYSSGGGEEEGQEEGEQMVYAGLFWICYNGTFSASTCVAGNPFGHTAQERTTKFLVVVGVVFQVAAVVLALGYIGDGCCCSCCCCGRRHRHHDMLWRPKPAVVEILAIGGGLIFFVGGVCALVFVTQASDGDLTFGPSLFLALASSTLVINCGCLVSIYNRAPDHRPVFL